MGIIKVETPDGIKKIEIAGDTPTAEEKNAIINTFSPKTKKIDLSAAIYVAILIIVFILAI